MSCIFLVMAFSQITPSVEVEEMVATCASPGNGAGPFWCYGSPLVFRHGDDVFVSAMETLEFEHDVSDRHVFARGAVSAARWLIQQPVGLYDMAGNAAEWCLDRYGPYSDEEQTDPAGPAKGKERVIRGGSFFSEPWNCTASARFHMSPYRRASYVGFRMAAVISDAATYRSLAGLDEKGAEGGKGK